MATFTLTACMLNMETGSSILREGNLLNVTRCRHGKCDNDVSKSPAKFEFPHYFHTLVSTSSRDRLINLLLALYIENGQQNKQILYIIPDSNEQYVFVTRYSIQNHS